MMMMAAKELKLPPKVFATPERYEIGRGPGITIYMMTSLMKGMGFNSSTENTTGKQVASRTLSDALFYIQPHLHGRISNFIPFCLLDQVYTMILKPTSMPLPPVKKEALDKINNSLFALMLLPVMQAAIGGKNFHAWAKNIVKYIEYLERQASRINARSTPLFFSLLVMEYHLTLNLLWGQELF